MRGVADHRDEKAEQEAPVGAHQEGCAAVHLILRGISLINLFNDLDMVEIQLQAFGWLNNYKDHV